MAGNCRSIDWVNDVLANPDAKNQDSFLYTIFTSGDGIPNQSAIENYAILQNFNIKNMQAKCTAMVAAGEVTPGMDNPDKEMAHICSDPSRADWRCCYGSDEKCPIKDTLESICVSLFEFPNRDPPTICEHFFDDLKVCTFCFEGQCGGGPHFQTWIGEWYDYHGEVRLTFPY